MKFTNTSLEKFKLHNPSIEITEEDEYLILENLWSDDTFILRYEKDIDFSDLEEIELPIEFCAIYHKVKKTLEFIYTPLPEKMAHLTRVAKFYFKGIEFLIEYKEPSPQLVLISKGLKEIQPSTESNYRNLTRFRDYYCVDQQTAQMKSYFKDKKPFSFFVTGDFDKINNDFNYFSKHLNIYLKYFDRKSPVINILNLEPKIDDYSIPCKSAEIDYPEAIIANEIDSVVLDLLHTANETTNPRLKYLFHYQVLEYLAYYYLDEELKRKINNLLKNPDILQHYNNYSKIIIEEIKEHSNNSSDKDKLKKLISDYLTVEDVKNELLSNIKYFAKDVEFDGNFKLSALLSDEKMLDKIYSDLKETKEKRKEKDKAKQDLISIIADRIEKIRNVMVHIRESRENKVIYPTKNNNVKLLPYLYLIRRISEIVAMKYNL